MGDPLDDQNDGLLTSGRMPGRMPAGARQAQLGQAIRERRPRPGVIAKADRTAIGTRHFDKPSPRIVGKEQRRGGRRVDATQTARIIECQLPAAAPMPAPGQLRIIDQLQHSVCSD